MEKDIFGPKINNIELFSKPTLQILLKLYAMTGIKKLLKVTVLDFCEILSPKSGKWVISGPKITLLNFFSKSGH